MNLSFRALFALWTCKLLRAVSRLLNRGGTALPGRVAQKIYPDLLSRLSGSVNTVAVTGTNGKTTCSRIIEEAFREAGLAFFANRSGANLMSGVLTEFVMNAGAFGQMKKKYAVIECDEAAARTVFGQLKPQVIVVTNLFRDQLDRYGEITHTLSNIREGIRNVPEAVLCLNADCSLTASLAGDGLVNPVIWYGIEGSAGFSASSAVLSDASHCIRCKTEYEYDYHTYAHLGGFRCPKCGYRRPQADYAVEKILSANDSSSKVLFREPAGETKLTINLPAVYNLYNAAAAAAAVETVGIAPEICHRALSEFACGFGRMESFPLAGGTRMILVKNPAGCTQALQYLSGIDKDYVLVVCLNDHSADGTDVSWIWDAEFEQLEARKDRIRKLFVSGDRAQDMRVRLKYAGLPDERITVQTDSGALVEALKQETLPLYILPTYTAMLALRGEIVHRCGGTEFWE